jgi:AcrR family transcriptional regulator
MPKQTFFNLTKEKRDIIIAAAVEEFLAKPYVKASVESIIEKAAITKGSFYRYFVDKNDILFHVLDQYLASYTVEIKNGNYDILNYEMLTKNVDEMKKKIGEVGYYLIVRLSESPPYVFREWSLKHVLPSIAPYYESEFNKKRIEDKIDSKYDAEFLAYLYSTSGSVATESLRNGKIKLEDRIKYNKLVVQTILKGIGK